MRLALTLKGYGRGRRDGNDGKMRQSAKNHSDFGLPVSNKWIMRCEEVYVDVLFKLETDLIVQRPIVIAKED